MVSAPARRQQAAFALRRGVSQRKVCALFSLARSALCYESRMKLRDAPLVALMVALAAQYPRYGYRRIVVFMEREGHKMGPDKAYRLWCAAGLQVPRKRPRKRVAASRPRPNAPSFAKEVWAYDFVYDACANGQQVKCLTIVDEFTRERLAIDVAGSIRSGRVIEVLSRLVSERGAPQHLRSDNGPEFVSRAFLRWADLPHPATTRFRPDCLALYIPVSARLSKLSKESPPSLRSVATPRLTVTAMGTPPWHSSMPAAA